MAEFKYKTKGNASPQDKPRVYFTCHPDDFSLYFDKICNDVFKTHDVAICYTEDMTEPLDQSNIEKDLDRIHLFLVPVTLKLLKSPCRAMQVDIAYAKQNNKCILPLLMEDDIESIYKLPENFGKLQYLSPFAHDSTAISYEAKLKKYLDEKLLNAKLIKEIKAEFDSYIFLSYRKKDRKYANDLMKAMHSIPGCRDIAIWFDEFLIPGEDWYENITVAMDDVRKKSNLFALLVTPSLLEYVEQDGEMIPNFVMRKEYPAAKTMGMNILPSEMESTDRDELHAKFDGIPDPIRTEDEHFSETILSVIKNISNPENDNDPNHNYLIGLAYLNGIDVEVNTARGVELITLAAEAEHTEAMYKLYQMYMNGDNVKLDYNEAFKWIKRLVDLCTKEYGEDSITTIEYSFSLAIVYKKLENEKRLFSFLRKSMLG